MELFNLVADECEQGPAKQPSLHLRAPQVQQHSASRRCPLKLLHAAQGLLSLYKLINLCLFFLNLADVCGFAEQFAGLEID